MVKANPGKRYHPFDIFLFPEFNSVHRGYPSLSSHGSHSFRVYSRKKRNRYVFTRPHRFLSHVICKSDFIRTAPYREVLLVGFSRKSKTRGVLWLGVTLPSHETSPSYPECLCVLKHIAGVHKVYLGKYVGTRATTAREYNAIDSENSVESRNRSDR